MIDPQIVAVELLLTGTSDHGPEITKRLTAHQQRIELTEEQAQRQWDRWSILEKRSAIDMFEILQVTGGVAGV